jgi:ADP-ribose diphosphatase
MADRLEWQEIKTEYREGRGTDVRWIVNRETIYNPQTGVTVTRGCLRHPGICVVVPFLDPETIILMRQYRYSIDGELWELPAGTLEGREEDSQVVPTESPEECAARELREETGYEAEKLEKVAECYAMPGSSDELMHVFFASGLREGQQKLDEGELIKEIRPVSSAELVMMLSRNEIRDAKTLVALFFALSRRPSGLQISQQRTAPHPLTPHP